MDNKNGINKNGLKSLANWSGIREMKCLGICVRPHYTSIVVDYFPITSYHVIFYSLLSQLYENVPEWKA